MKQMTLPNAQNSDTGGSIPEAYRGHTVSVPDQLTTKDTFSLHFDFLNQLGRNQVDLENKIADYKKEVDKYKDELTKQSSRNIEIIGLFSSVLALLIIDVNVIKAVPSFLAAILLITALTASLLIFASLIHTLFSHEESSNIGKISFWAGVIVLSILIVVGSICHAMGWDFYHSKNLTNTLEQSELNTIPGQE